MIKSLAEERVTTAIDVAALQQREERRGARAHPRAPRRPSAAVREGAATHAPRRGRRGGSRGGTAPCLRLRPHVARGEAAATEIEKLQGLQRTLRAEREEHTRTKGVVCRLD